MAEIKRISEHVDISLTGVLARIDLEIGRADEDKRNQVPGAERRLAKAERRHKNALLRRERRRAELEQQQSMTLQGVGRLASLLVLPHPETEMTTMRIAIEYQKSEGYQSKMCTRRILVMTSPVMIQNLAIYV